MELKRDMQTLPRAAATARNFNFRLLRSSLWVQEQRVRTHEYANLSQDEISSMYARKRASKTGTQERK